MKKQYIVAYTLYLVNCYKTRYRHFDNLEHAIRFAKSSNINNNFIIYESIEV